MSKLTLSIRHTTHYAFTQPVVHALQRLRLTPKATQGQRIIEWQMHFDNAHAELSYDDQHFNHVTLIGVNPGAREVTVTCEGIVETEDNAGVIGRHSGHLPLWSFLRQTPLTRPGAKLRGLAAEHRLPYSLLLRQLDESFSGAAAKTHKPKSEGFFEGVKRFFDDLTS